MPSLLTVEIREDAEDFLLWVGEQIRPTGGTLIGDSSRGQFCLAMPIGEVAGDYWLRGRELTIMVTRKPFFLSTVELKNQLLRLLRERGPRDGASAPAIVPEGEQA